MRNSTIHVSTGSQPTYEGLKPLQHLLGHSSLGSSQPTYEGLKHDVLDDDVRALWNQFPAYL